MTTDTTPETIWTADHPEVVAATRFLAPIFSVEGWTYGWSEPHVPDSIELAEVIVELINMLERTPEDRRGTCSTGRIVVSYDRYSSVTRYKIALDIGRISRQIP
jgi:hypothetical protein